MFMNSNKYFAIKAANSLAFYIYEDTGQGLDILKQNPYLGGQTNYQRNCSVTSRLPSSEIYEMISPSNKGLPVAQMYRLLAGHCLITFHQNSAYSRNKMKMFASSAK